MAGMCVSFPFVGEEPSKLYKEVLKFTGNNRKLTNLIYATALQPWYIAKFSSSDLNSQGELNSSVVIEDLKVADLIKTEDLIKDILHSLNAIDSSGNPVEYDTVEEILDRVLNLNLDLDSKVIAKIVNKNGKYIIDVQSKDDTNYNIYEHYKTGEELLKEILTSLDSVGFDISDLSAKSLIALNALNAQNFSVLLLKLLNLEKHTYLSENQVELFLLMQRSSVLVQRLFDKFGEDTVKAVKYLLTDSEDIPVELGHLSSLFTPATKELVKSLRKNTAKKALRIDVKNLVNKLKVIYNSNKIIEHEDIQKTLKNLYKNWHLDKDTIYAAEEKINSLENASTQIISRLYNNMLFLRSKGVINIEEREKREEEINTLQRKVDKKKYALSILDFLKKATEELETLSDIEVELIEPDSYNAIAANILYAKLLINNYSPIIEALMNVDKLKLAEDLELSDIEDIKKLSFKINELLKTIEKGTYKDGELVGGIKDKWFTLVYKYLKERWGEDKKEFKQEGKETLGSFEMALELVLRYGTNIELNICDRLLFNMTEVSDPVLAVFGQSIKDLHKVRDNRVVDIMTQIRRTTDRLYKSGSNSEFMFEAMSDGMFKIISEIDYDSYYEAKNQYKKDLKARGFKGDDLQRRLEYWEEKNTEEYTVPGLKLLPEITGEDEEHPVVIIAPKGFRKKMPLMTKAQEDYYNTMMSIKASMEYNLQRHGIKISLFQPVQVTSSVSEAIANASPSEAFKLLKDNFVDNFSIREDDTNYGSKEVLIDADKHELKQLPVYYVRTLSDLKRLSKDFSKALLTYSAMATNYSVMAEHINSLELVKEFLLEREIEQKSGNKSLIGVHNIENTRLVTPVIKKTRETYTGKWIEGIMDTKVYGIRHKSSGTIGGTNISIDKLADVATTYSSVTGLAANVPGAVANALVGKLQMIIEAGGGEFFNLIDFNKAALKYDALLPELWKELNSNNKKSMLHLLMLKFDVLDDFYDKIRETGFYTNGLNKIIGNTSLFFLYGLGEHLLHALGMLSCLYHTKVIDTKTNKKVPLIEVFDREIKDNNGILIIKEGYKTLDGKEINEAFIERLKNSISYVNRSMHGAFGFDEKGLIHQYAWGRLIMNFRQWMPAHYARRFNQLHWDATLGDFREGYYVTASKFIIDCAKQISKGSFDLATRYKSLNDMLKANLRRTLTESLILIALYWISALDFGDDPKHRTKLEALAKYEVRRMLLETSASNPLSIFRKGDFFDNVYKTLNEPIAALSPAQRLTRLFGIEDLIMVNRVKSGPHEGDLVYFRNFERAVPFYDQVYKWWNMDTDNSIFQVFNERW